MDMADDIDEISSADFEDSAVRLPQNEFKASKAQFNQPIQFVCTFCLEFKGIAYIKIVNAVGTTEEIQLQNTTDPFTFIADLGVSHGILKGRVMVRLEDSSVTLDENVGTGNYINLTVFRQWNIDAETQLISAIVKDRFAWKYWTRSSNEICNLDQFVVACWRLVLYMAKQFRSLLVSEFGSMLKIYTNTVYLNDFARFFGSHIEDQIVFQSVATGHDDNQSDTFIKWVVVLMRIRRITPNARKRPLTVNLFQFNACEIFQELKCLTDGLILTSVIDFVSDFLNQSDHRCVPWALLCLAVRGSDRAAENVIFRNPSAIPYSLETFLPFLEIDTMNKLLGLLPNFRTLRYVLISTNLWVPNGVFTLPLDEIGILRQIFRSAKYLKCEDCSESAVEEFAAISDLIKGLKDSSLIKDLFGFHSFRIASIAHLPLFELATVFLLAAIAHPFISEDLKFLRMEELKTFFKRKISEDRKFERSAPAEIYKILRSMFMFEEDTNCQDSNSAPVLSQRFVNEIHSWLPTVLGPGLSARISCYVQETNPSIVRLEATALEEICRKPNIDRSKLRQFLWTPKQREQLLCRHGGSTNSLVTVDWTRGADLLSVTWMESLRSCQSESQRLSIEEISLIRSMFTEVARDGVDLCEYEYTVHFLTNSKVRELHAAIIEEVQLYPYLIESKLYGQIYKLVQATSDCILNITRKLISENVTLNVIQVFEQHVFLATSINVTNIDSMSRKILCIRSEWNNLLIGFRDYMSQHLSFEKYSVKLAEVVSIQLFELEKRELSSWKSPEFGGGGIQPLLNRLFGAQESLIYRWIWTRECRVKCIDDSNVLNEHEVITNWSEMIYKTFRDWLAAIKDIYTKKFSRILLKDICSCLLDSSAIAPPDLPNSAVEACEMSNRFMMASKEIRELRIRDEFKITYDVLRDTNVFDREKMQEVLYDFVSALAFSRQSFYILQISRLVQCPNDLKDPLVRFDLHMSGIDTSISETISMFQDVKARHPAALQIMDRFPEVFHSLILEGGSIEHGLLSLLSRYPDALVLNQTIDRLIQSAEPRSQELLLALQQTRDALDVLVDEIDCYPLICAYRMSNIELLTKYLASTSWCLGGIKRLLGGIQILSDLIESGASSSSTMMKVQALTSKYGKFLISIPDAKLTAYYALSDGNEKNFTTIELGDIPFQLCLSGSSKAVDLTPQDEIMHNQQQHYLKFVNLMSQICTRLHKLAYAGHPNYQSGKAPVEFNGQTSLRDLEKVALDYHQELHEWQLFLTKSDLELPFLTCFTRYQLVKSMQLAQDISADASIYEMSELLHCIFPHLQLQTASDIIQTSFTDSQSYEDRLHDDYLSCAVKLHRILAACIHFAESSKKVSFSNVLQSHINKFQGNVTSKFRKDNNLYFVKFGRETSFMHTGFVCSLYLSKLGRLPLTIEVLVCQKDTAEQDVVDFTRRWKASQHFPKLENEGKTCWMFSILNVELLKANVQNVALACIHEYRHTVNTPLFLSASQSDDDSSILSYGLRNDWVSCTGGTSQDYENALFESCSLICRSYFRSFFEFVQVYKSPTTSSGKTTSIIENLVIPDHAPYICIPLTGDCDEVVALLKKAEKYKEIKVVIHFNVSNTLDIELLNRFAFSYFVRGVISDSSGNSVSFNPYNVELGIGNVVAIEWPSEGVLADIAYKKCPLISSFCEKCPSNALNVHQFRFSPLETDSDCIIYRVEVEENREFNIGIRMSLAFISADKDKTSFLPFHDTIQTMIIPEPYDLYEVIANVVNNGRDMTTQPPPPPGLVYRFMKFLANQMFGLYCWAFYEYWTAENERDDTSTDIDPAYHCRNYSRLGYYFAKTSFRLALKLAAAAISPLSDNISNVDDDRRLETLLFSFDDWREEPFIIFQGGTYPEMVTVTGKDFLLEITDGNKDPNFSKFLEVNKQAMDRSVQSLCCQLSDEHYNPVNSGSNHALRRLLPMIGDKSEFGIPIFRALEYLHESNRPPDYDFENPITLLYDKHGSALSELREVVGYEELSDDLTIGDFVRQAKKWFESITGSYLDADAVPFILTVDNLIRLLAIKLRLCCEVPVVFVGETGCGKTHLGMFYSKVSGSLMEVINIHGGMSPQDLLFDITKIINRADGRRVVVLLDEINSMPSVWSIKEAVCERMVLGRRIPSNIRFICIMNPRRCRQFVTESQGLDFSPYQLSDADTGTKTNITSALPLVYEVHRAPESIMCLVWDFGLPCFSAMTRDDALALTHNRTPFPNIPEWRAISDELVFTENMIHWMISSRLAEFERGHEGLSVDFRNCDRGENNGSRHLSFFRILLCATINVSQNYMREVGFRDISASSLRDISRTISLIPLIITIQQRQHDCGHVDGNDNLMYFRFLNVAVLSSLTLNYALRLDNKQRREYFEIIQCQWNSVRLIHQGSISKYFLPSPKDGLAIYNAFDRLATTLCGSLILDSDMAINEALKENVTSLFCSIMGDLDTGTSQFIVGRPGSSKSSSLDILCSSTDPDSTDERTKFFKYPEWFKIMKFVLQCTPDTTAADILRVAEKAATFQRLNEKCRCVIVLEEVGVTVGSKHNPLMVLHGLVDRGVMMEDRSYVRLPIIGISNWRLDASKMNRMRTTHRGNPSVDDLIKTADCIVKSKVTNASSQFISQQENRDFNNALRRFSEVFHDLVLSNESSHNPDLKSLAWFYGMRDFYAFVQLLQIHRSQSLQNEIGLAGSVSSGLDPHLIKWAIQINFGGHPNPKIESLLSEKIFQSFYPKRNGQAQSASWSRRESDDERNLCDMCSRISHYADLKILSFHIGSTVSTIDRVLCFNHSFQKLKNATGAVCTEVARKDCFSALRILSYCLNIQSSTANSNNKTVSSIYRVRHVLLFTKANSALYLLESLKIVRTSNAVIIFNRSDPTPRNILDDLILCRRCMLSGGVLILIGAKHIYESLYDVLNQHHSVEGVGIDRKYFTKLTMNGYTTIFPISSSFRCIVIEQESTCYELLPPFINRFVKASLNYSTALSPQQKKLSISISTSSMIIPDDSSIPINLLKLLIPGFSDDTIDSLAYLFPTEKLTSDYEISQLKSIAVERLGFMCCPRRMLQISTGLFGKFSSNQANEVLNYWRNGFQRLHTLSDDIDSLRRFHESPDEIPHVFLVTEHRSYDFIVLNNALSKIYPHAELGIPNTIDLTRLTDEADISCHLHELASFSGPAYCVFVLDVQSTDFRQSNNVSRLEKFMYLLNKADLPVDKHVALLVILRNTSSLSMQQVVNSENKIDFNLHFDPKWLYLYLDEVFEYVCDDESYNEEKDDISTLTDNRKWQETSSNCNFPSWSLACLFDPSDNLVDILDPNIVCEFLASRSLSIAQKVRSSRDIAIMNDHLKSTFEAPTEDSAAYAIAARVLEGICEVEDLRSGKWRRIALKRIKFAESLRLHLLMFVSSLIEKSFLQYSTSFFSFENIYHCSPYSTASSLFRLLVSSHVLIPQEDLSKCVFVDIPTDIQWRQTFVDGDDMFADGSVATKFPFSFLLYPMLRPIAEMSLEMSHLSQRLEEILQGRILSPEECFLYFKDILTQKGLRGDDQHDAIIKLLSWISNVSSLEFDMNICSIHNLLAFHIEIFEAAVRFTKSRDNNMDALLNATVSTDINDFVNILISTASHMSGGIINLNSISDIVILTTQQGESFQLLLHQAVSLAMTSSLNQKHCKEDAVAFIKKYGINREILALSFGENDKFACEASKFLLPVLFEDIGDEEESSILRIVLQGSTQWITANLPRASMSFVITRVLNFLMKHDTVDYVGLGAVNYLSDLVQSDKNSIDGIAAVIISRCVFDICSDACTILQFAERFGNIRESNAKSVIVTGIITSGLELIARFMKGEITQDESTIVVLNNRIDELMSTSINNNWITDATLFLLRVLSSGGVELEVARNAIRDRQDFLPISIKNHFYTIEMCKEESLEDKVQLLLAFKDYRLALTSIKQAIGFINPIDQEDSTATLLNGLDPRGVAAAILDLAVRIEDKVNPDRITLINLFAQHKIAIKSEALHIFIVNTLENIEYFLFPNESMKHIWISVVILSLTSENTTILSNFGDMIMQQQNRPRKYIFPSDHPSNDNDIGNPILRLLYSSSALAYAVQQLNAQVNSEEIRKHSQHILNHILMDKCPGCKGAIEDWPGCFSVTCDHCQSIFCGWCFKVCPGDAHPHVLNCPHNPQQGNYHGTKEQFKKVRMGFQSRKLDLYLNQLQGGLKNAVINEISEYLTLRGFPIDSFGVDIGYSIQLSLYRLQNSVTSIKNALFRSATTIEPALHLLQAVLLLHLSECNEPCASDEEVVKIVSQVQHRAMLIGPTSLVDSFRSHCKNTPQGILTLPNILSWDGAFEKRVANLTPEELECQMPHHFAFRTRVTVDMFWDRVETDPELSLLKYLHEHFTSLDGLYSKQMIIILNYVGDVCRICNNIQMSFKRAKETTLGQLIETSNKENILGGRRLRNFCQALSAVFQRVERYECKTRKCLEGIFGALKFDESIPIVYILPTEKDEGLFINVLYKGMTDDTVSWQSLGLAQNEAVDMINKTFNIPLALSSITAEKRSFNLSEHDLVLYNEERDTNRFLPIFIDPYPIAKFSEDISTLQLLVANGTRMWGKPKLSASLPQYSYSEDKRKSVFGKLADIIDCEILDAELQDRIVTIISHDPSFGPPCLAFLTIAAFELTCRPLAAIPSKFEQLASFISIPFTDEQRKGQEMLTTSHILRELKTSHILSFSALLWDGGVVPEASRPLEVNDAAYFVRKLDEIRENKRIEFQPLIPNFIIALRLLGMRYLCTEQTLQFLCAPISVGLEPLMGNFYSEEMMDWLGLNVIAMSHFEGVFQSVDQILSPCFLNKQAPLINI